MSEINKRYDFIYFFDVMDGNPNGDPDAGNMPRIDAETGIGLVTDVCLKRKVRNYVNIIKLNDFSYDIYVKEKAVLGKAHWETFQKLGIPLGQESRILIPEDMVEIISGLDLPEGITFEEEEKCNLVFASDVDVKEIKEWIKEAGLSKDVKKIIESNLKNIKARKPTSEETEKGKKEMCNRFFDIRAFGAVLSLKTAPNCGQVRGPIQLTFARSLEPIVTLEHSITRMAVATEAEAEKQSGDNRTMGRKYTVPYGLYKTHGFVSAHLAAQTGFSKEDLELFWNALQEMFEHDHSAARGLMSARALIVFEHETALGNKPAHELFERVTWKRATEGPARGFSDYALFLDEKPLKKTFEVVPVGK